MFPITLRPMTKSFSIQVPGKKKGGSRKGQLARSLTKNVCSSVSSSANDDASKGSRNGIRRQPADPHVMPRLDNEPGGAPTSSPPAQANS
ncbi:unnamed protein product [Caenorhabditis auriculariae]|uniref:Uncharacterized protein n=1 Tax=Caenorhabditis auriculariae TaxID=2777116 RepID=A0A8S1H2Y5_9PELO|nr:unnamed protein product [Caenorhabditis auriculariae]